MYELDSSRSIPLSLGRSTFLALRIGVSALVWLCKQRVSVILNRWLWLRDDGTCLSVLHRTTLEDVGWLLISESWSWDFMVAGFKEQRRKWCTALLV